MKNKHIFILLVAIAACTWSCQNYDAQPPNTCVLVEALNGDQYETASNFKVGEDVYISSCGDADLYAVWYGDAGNDYAGKDDRGTDDEGNVIWTNTGSNLSIENNAHVVHAYATAGSYTITLVATNTSRGSTDVELIRETVTQVVTITD